MSALTGLGRDLRLIPVAVTVWAVALCTVFVPEAAGWTALAGTVFVTAGIGVLIVQRRRRPRCGSHSRLEKRSQNTMGASCLRR